MPEEKKYIDEAGLAAFWASVENALTRMYQNIPEGKQIARVYQKNGRLHVEVEDFGGSTESAKIAARGSLGVGIYYGSLPISTVENYMSAGKFNAGDIVTLSDSGDISDPIPGDPLHTLTVVANESIIRCTMDGVTPYTYWVHLPFLPQVTQTTDVSDTTTLVTSVTQEGNSINVKSRNVGLVYVQHEGAHCIKFG